MRRGTERRKPNKSDVTGDNVVKWKKTEFALRNLDVNSRSACY